MIILNVLGYIPKKIERISLIHFLKRIFSSILSILMALFMVIGFLIAMLFDRKERIKEHRLFPDYFYDKYGDIL